MWAMDDPERKYSSMFHPFPYSSQVGCRLSGIAEIGHARHTPLSTWSTRDDPDRVNDAWNVAQERQQNVEPELSAQADSKEHAHGRKQDCE
jgi:hypothetical protein